MAFALLVGLGTGSIAAAQLQNKKPAATQLTTAAPPRNVIQKLRDFLGINPPVAVGGSRSGPGWRVCLLSPWTNSPLGVTTPVLEAVGPLNELRLEQGGQVLWQKRASSTEAIEGPTNWPIRPLNPGEVITLKVRPRGASGGDFASYTLRTDNAEALETNRIQLERLGREPKTWYRHIESMSPKQVTLLAPLLASPNAPAALRQQLQCTGTRNES
ncbi:hypothetical protein KBY65_13340 [Cyanobium sp. Alchichica 3B3-8F6]|uniref:hypothetical protein n=1 Tax=Cyanobium sp. Alchichica 3B3-8F6 TaxID=2823696 RepID=UPI0020CBB985|nr:hypothetical protein [Cyanobium sp. Alchichica 3B3-8F6]MCP9883439.1 hypothetical protein [Cyanobium sp. Alchichica 3B3-8F6]